MARTLKQLVRLRMAETGEKYTTALRFIEQADMEYMSGLKARMAAMKQRAKYPFTDRDGLSRRHVLSAMETNRRHH